MLEKLFKLKEHNTTIKTEAIAGITTFMTMAYIIFVNPSILEAAGMPRIPTVAATALAAAIPTILMGLFTNYPFALASGMGINAVIAFSFVKGMGLPWQTAMGMVAIEGIIISILVVTRIREMVMKAIPMDLKRGIGVGIGLLIAYIGMREAGWIIQNPDTFTTAGSLHSPATLVSTTGFILILALMAWQIKGSILIGILATSVLAIALGVGKIPHTWVGIPDFSTIGQTDIVGALRFSLLAPIFALMLTDFFDTMGTVIAVGGQAGYLDENGRLPRLNRVLLVDSMAAIWGSICCASSVTTYIESAAGVSVGGRTGLTSVVTGLLFLLAIFFAPTIGIVPAAATAPALIIVGFLMMSLIKDMDFENLEESLPAFVTIITIPLSGSISRGIGYGFIAYVLVKALRGRFREINPALATVSVLFAVSFFLDK